MKPSEAASTVLWDMCVSEADRAGVEMPHYQTPEETDDLTREYAADVLETTADILERGGRCRGEMRQGQRHCLLGAFSDAGIRVARQWRIDGRESPAQYSKLIADAIHRQFKIGAGAGPEIVATSMAMFNDQVMTSVGHNRLSDDDQFILDGLRDAAKEWKP